MKKILCLAGDGVGPELMNCVFMVANQLRSLGRFNAEFENGLIGGVSVDTHGWPATDEVIRRARDVTAVMLGAVGGPKWDSVPRAQRPEQGLLELRRGMEVYANLRPIRVHDHLAHLSPLREEVVANADFIIVRELLGGIYFGQPRGTSGDGSDKRAFDTMIYNVSEIDRIARVAFELARMRRRKVHSIDKANVLETSALWRDTVARLWKREYHDVELHHMYIDNASIQVIRDPRQFDIVLTENMFGDILSDAAAAVAGSLGMLPSASLAGELRHVTRGLYEPAHGSAPDIAGKGICNPVATLQSFAMLIRFSLSDNETAELLEHAIDQTLQAGIVTADLAKDKQNTVGTAEFCRAVIERLKTPATSAASARMR